MHQRLAARFALCQDHSLFNLIPRSNSSKSAQRLRAAARTLARGLQDEQVP